MDKISVTLIYATPTKQWRKSLRVLPHANVAMAIRQSGFLESFTEFCLPELTVGIYGHKVSLDAALADGDRIEIYRPLLVDPMTARRRRQQQKR